MIPHDLRPGVGDVDIGFGAGPGKAGAVADDGVGIEGAKVDADKAAGNRADVDAGNAQIGRGAGAVVGLGRDVVVISHADPEFADQSGRKNAVVVDAAAIGALQTPCRQSAPARDRRPIPKIGRLENLRPLIAQANTEAIFFRGYVIHFHVIRRCVFVKRQQREVVVCAVVLATLGAGRSRISAAEIGLIRLIGI